MNRKVYIYGLHTDKDDTIMYVGKTVNKLKSRLYNHISKSKNGKSKKDMWILESIKLGYKILIKKIEICDCNNWKEREIHWIDKLSKLNKSLTNSTKGGECGSYIKKYKLSFIECRKIVRSMNISSIKEYRKHKDIINNTEIPNNPRNVYEMNGWTSWVDFLGNGRVSNSKRNFISYEDCQKYAIDNNINSYAQWYEDLNRTPDIPSCPYKEYKDKWINWNIFLKNGKLSNKSRKFISYEDCQKYAIDNNIGSKSEWLQFIKNNDIPKYIPRCPRSHFKEKFKGWGDFLNTKRIQYNKISESYFNYTEAKKWIFNNLYVKTVKEYKKIAKEGRLPKYIPNRPERFYSNKNRGWIDWYDFLGKR